MDGDIFSVPMGGGGSFMPQQHATPYGCVPAICHMHLVILPVVLSRHLLVAGCHDHPGGLPLNRQSPILAGRCWGMRRAQWAATTWGSAWCPAAAAIRTAGWACTAAACYQVVAVALLKLTADGASHTVHMMVWLSGFTRV